MDLATVDHLLTTTRAVRKRLDLERPVEPEVLERCIEIALQAPSGSNRQGWHFVVVTDPAKRRALADLYRRSFRAYAASSQPQPPPAPAEDDPRIAQAPRVRASATYLSERMHEVPVLVIPCIEGRAEHAGVSAQAALYGSILPATWSLMLALRARGLGTAWTTLHLVYEREAAAILDIPDSVTQVALIPVAYFRGTGFPARQAPARRPTGPIGIPGTPGARAGTLLGPLPHPC